MTANSAQTFEFSMLVTAIADRRDQQAFTRLFDFFAPRITSWLVRTGCEHAQAEDIAQDAMTVLWHKAALFDPAKSSLGTWLYRIARNRRIDGIRRDRIDYRDPADYAVDVADPDAPDPAHAMDARNHEKILRTAMNGLTEDQTRLVHLAFFEGLSHSEISARTGLPLGTVKSRIRLAFARLRVALEAKGIVEAD